MNKDVFIHPTAIVDTQDIDVGTRLWAYVHVMPGARIGAHCNIGDHTFIEGGTVIGNNVTIKNGNMIWEGVTIEDNVFLGPGAIFTNDLYPRSPRMPSAVQRYSDKANWLVPTLVKNGASIGAGSIIIAGVTIGRYALVAAGAVVSKDVPDFALVRGNPAQIKGWVSVSGQRLKFSDGIATHDGQTYRFSGGIVEIQE